MKDKKSFLVKSFWAFILRVLGAISGLILNLVVAKSLSLEESGLFFISFTICTVISMLASLGLTNAFLRFVGGYLAEDNWPAINGVLQYGLKSAFFASCVTAMLIYLSSDLISQYVFAKPELSGTLSVMILAVPAMTFFLLISFAFQGVHKAKVSVFIQNISSQFVFILLLSLLIVLSIQVSSVLAAIVFVIATAITALIGFRLWFNISNTKIAADNSVKDELLTAAKSMWIVIAAGLLIQYGGQIITGIFSSSQEVALFAVSQKIAMLTSFVLITVNMIAAPKFAASAKLGNKDELRAVSLFASRIMVFIATPVVVVMLTFPKILLGFFGEEYKQASLILQILVVGQFISVITGSVGFLLNMTGHEKDMRNTLLITGPMSLLLAVILASQYGVVGAAIATSIGLSAQNLLAVFFVKKRLGFNTLNLIKQ